MLPVPETALPRRPAVDPPLLAHNADCGARDKAAIPSGRSSQSRAFYQLSH